MISKEIKSSQTKTWKEMKNSINILDFKDNIKKNRRLNLTYSSLLACINKELKQAPIMANEVSVKWNEMRVTSMPQKYGFQPNAFVHNWSSIAGSLQSNKWHPSTFYLGPNNKKYVLGENIIFLPLRTHSIVKRGRVSSYLVYIVFLTLLFTYLCACCRQTDVW